MVLRSFNEGCKGGRWRCVLKLVGSGLVWSAGGVSRPRWFFGVVGVLTFVCACLVVGSREIVRRCGSRRRCRGRWGLQE
jgi:hypothetical protein